ncbi:hypothetical protein [Tateyamaria sp. Alg231-49]|uniref:hypothetical protein n=1 Tax=Tateyamaria sp. Alg231-49 TaxID=1922219 RepID=UPI00131F351A|nr:hypothetical protein [Tateyamaria sp. Alg231-49]
MKRPKATTVSGEIHAERLTRLPTLRWPNEVERFPDPTDQDRADGAFEAVISSRAPDQWSRTDVQEAATYAVHFTQSQKLQRALMRTGPLVSTSRGGHKRNPLYLALEYHEAAVARLARRLSLNLIHREDLRTAANVAQSYRDRLGRAVTIDADAPEQQLPNANGPLAGLIQ